MPKLLPFMIKSDSLETLGSPTHTRKIIVVLLSDVAIFTEPDSDNLDLAAIFKSGQR